MKQGNRRKPKGKVSPKNKHKWGVSLSDDLNKVMGGNGNAGKVKK